MAIELLLLWMSGITSALGIALLCVGILASRRPKENLDVSDAITNAPYYRLGAGFPIKKG